MVRVGITGNIGSGKSTVVKIFAALGIPVYYADVRASELMNSNKTIHDELCKTLGNDIYIDNELDRKKLAALIFSDDKLRKLVNALVHPIVAYDFEDWFSHQQGLYVLKEAALLFESGSYKQLDKIICITAPFELRLNRVINRDNRSREQVLAIESKQMSEAEKIKLSDYIIINDESEPVIPQVLNIHKKILEINLAKSSKSMMSDF